MNAIYLFGEYRLDPARRELTRAGALQAVEPQVLDLILDLIEHRERLVTRDELIERIWHGRIVAEATLSSRVKTARQAIGDNGRDQALIRTVHGRGFRFVGAVRIAAHDRNGDAAALVEPEAAAPQQNVGVPVPMVARQHAPLETGAVEVAPAAAHSSSTVEGRRYGAVAERRQLTIVRCSLSNAALASAPLDPEELNDFLSRAQAILVRSFEEFGGHIARTYAAGVLAYFGWPRASEDAAHSAVLAALAAERALGRLNDNGRLPAESRSGIATGTVLIGGNEARLAVGRAPVLAVRLMELAGPGMVVVSQSTRALLGEAFFLEQHRSEGIAEFGEADRVWRVLGTADTATRFEAAGRSPLTPLIGREDELALLRRRWERTAAGEGQVVLVSGDAGIGKSRLVHDFAATLDPSDQWRISCQCSPHHENSALLPLIREMGRVAQLERDDDEATRTDKIRRLVARTGQWPTGATELITELLSADCGRLPPTVWSPERRQELTLDILMGMVRWLARQRPLLFLLEDAHWIDPTTAVFMHRIVDLADEAPVLVLITHRPGYTPPWAGRTQVSQLSLSGLTAADTALMARHLAGEVRLSGIVQAQIAERTGGVPLYVEELIRAILAAHPPHEKDGTSPRLLSDIPEELPATLQDLLLSQLDQLGEAGEVARIGAVIGRSFGRDLLREIADLPEDAIDAALRHLCARGIVLATGAPPRERYMFKHALVQDASYQSLLHDRRRGLHARIAAALEHGVLGGPATEPEILAHHFEKAGQFAKAFDCWRGAGEAAARRHAHAEAVAYLRRALALLEREPADATRQRAEAELLATLGRSAIAALGDGHPDIREIYLRLESICESIDDDRLRCDALFGLALHAQVQEHVERSLAIAKRYVEAAKRVGDGRQLAIAHWIRAQDYWRAGRFAESVAEARRGRRAFDARQPTPDMLEHPEMLNRIVEANCAIQLGQVKSALRDIRAMTEQAREAGNPVVLRRTLSALGFAHQLLRDVDETAVVMQQMAALSQTYRRPYHGGWILLRAWVLAAQGDMVFGLAQATNAISWLEIKPRRPRRLSILADCFAAAGQTDTARDLIAKGLAEVEASGERYWEAELHRQRGELVLAAGGAVGVAEASFDHALEIARAQQARLFELRAAVSLGRVWTHRGRGREAAALVEPVLSSFDDGFDFPDLRDARMLLGLAKPA